jgi:hypothetical protein
MRKKGVVAGIIILGVILISWSLFVGHSVFKNKLNKQQNSTNANLTNNSNNPDEIVIETGSESNCSVNADCVPASCCHPTSCTTKAKASNCSRSLCTQVCAQGSLDCGQGSCECLNNKCEAILNQ